MKEAVVTFDSKMFMFSLMVLIAVILLFVLLSIPVKMANKRGRSPVLWFLFSLIISPFLSMLFIALLGETNEKRRSRIIEEEELRMRYRN